MKRVRDSFALSAGRLTDRVMRLRGRRSTALPGYVAEKISRNPLESLVNKRQFAATILVTGTNGKTTTTLLTKNIFEQAGFQVVNNSSGSNLTRGVVTALLADKRHGKNTVLILEVDEASMPAVAAATQPTHVVVTNIFRDQLDRYGEVDYTRSLIERAIEQCPKTTLILCADDPHVARLGLHREDVKYFGLEDKTVKALPHDHAADIPVSPASGAPLEYSQRYFGHFGHYQARDKSFQRPTPDTVITDFTERQTGLAMTIRMGSESYELSLNMQGLYSAYNVAAAASMAHAFELDIHDILKAIRSTRSAFGRQETISIQGAECAFYLIKNPTGFNQVIQAALVRSVRDPILIIINDNFADGRDVSWLWDAAIEDIHPGSNITVAGTRAYDMALRLEYAGHDCQVIENPIHALKHLVAGHKRVIVLPTYTALLQLRKELNLNLVHQS